MSVISNCTYKRHEFLNQSLHLLNCTKKLPLKQLQKITLNSVQWSGQDGGMESRKKSMFCVGRISYHVIETSNYLRLVFTYQTD